jgi:AcrR family transcriptional regulator
LTEDRTDRDSGADPGRGTGRLPSRALELMWGLASEPRTRGSELSLDRIVSAAIAVADAEGLEALSMRRVARELGSGTMSLYRYVPGKADLLALMTDRISDPSEQIERTTGLGWRDTLESVARDMWNLYLAHPWMLGVNAARPVFGPNALAGIELIFTALAGLGLTDREKVTVLMTVDAYVTGSARSHVDVSTAAAETGIGDEEFWNAQYPVLEHAMATGNYPELAGLDEDAFTSEADDFGVGLRLLLDGLERLVESRRSGP